MKKAPILVLLTAALIIAAVPVSADYYATKTDFFAGVLTPGEPPVPKAGGASCASPTAIPPDGTVFNFNDTGDTTLGTSNVNAVPNTCTGTVFDGNASGPDHVWVFSVSAGNQLLFRVTTTSSTYDPMMYALGTCGDGLGSCQIGTDNCLGTDLEIAQNPTGPCQQMSTEQMVASFNPGTYYLYVDSWYSVAGSATQAQGPYALRVEGDVPVELLKFTID